MTRAAAGFVAGAIAATATVTIVILLDLQRRQSKQWRSMLELRDDPYDYRSLPWPT